MSCPPFATRMRQWENWRPESIGRVVAQSETQTKECPILRRRETMSRRRIIPPLAVGAIALPLAGCASPSSDEQLPEPAASETASTAPASTCVTDPEAVVTAELPAAATEPMPADLAATIDAAAATSFTEAAAPGAVVFVQTPEGTLSKGYGMADPTTGAPMTTDVTLQAPDATPENPTDATDWNPSWGWTAGELISTGQDMLVLARANGTGQGLLDAKSQVERLTSFPGEAGYGIATRMFVAISGALGNAFVPAPKG